MEQEILKIENLYFDYSDTSVLRDVNFTLHKGDFLGIIGANGAGKSTFLKILSGELDSTTGEVSIDPNCRMSVLKQDHFAYDEYTVLDTIIMGNKRLYDIMKEKDAIYAKEDFSEEEDSYEVLTAPDDFSAVREALEQAGVPMLEAQVAMVPQTYVELTDEKDIKNLQKTLDLLDEDDDVTDVWTNWDE